MHDEVSAGELEEKVRKVRKPLGDLIASLEPAMRPEGHAYGSNAKFDNEVPPPWQGEWDNKGA